MPNNPSTLQNRSRKIIGRFANLRPEIDPSDRVSSEITDKMSIVDLIPCSFNIGYGSKMPEFTFESVSKELLNLITPKLMFEEPIEAYREACNFYGLIPVDYLKVYLTDMSTGVDQITNTYDKNLISSSLESVSSNTLISKGSVFLESTGRSLTGVGDNISDLITEQLKKFKIDTGDLLGHSSSAITEALSHGTKVQFPKVWMGSSYSPNLQINIKLVSPYGHPQAIAEFITKPLGYILLLLAPKTQSGISLRRPNYIMLKAYGISNMVLCYPASIQIRRTTDQGGYNRFKQPLSIEIMLEFNSTSEGFASYLPSSENDIERDSFTSESLLKDFSEDMQGYNANVPLFPTLKYMADSFRPYKPYVVESSTSDDLTNQTQRRQSQIQNVANNAIGFSSSIISGIDVFAGSNIDRNADFTTDSNISSTSNISSSETQIKESRTSNQQTIKEDNETLSRQRSEDGKWSEDAFQSNDSKYDPNGNLIVTIDDTKRVYNDGIRFISDSQQNIQIPNNNNRLMINDEPNIQYINSSHDIIYEMDLYQQSESGIWTYTIKPNQSIKNQVQFISDDHEFEINNRRYQNREISEFDDGIYEVKVFENPFVTSRNILINADMIIEYKKGDNLTIIRLLFEDIEVNILNNILISSYIDISRFNILLISNESRNDVYKFKSTENKIIKSGSYRYHHQIQ